MSLSVSVAIACYKNDPFLGQATYSTRNQTYPCDLAVYHDNEGVGTGEAFNRAIAQSKSDIVILLCSDDVFADRHVVGDIVKVFEQRPMVGHVSRFYHQFVEDDRTPVRAWRNKDILELANNPSGLAFRRDALEAKGLSNKMFVEAAVLVKEVLADEWEYEVLPYDTVAVRIHQSISRTPGYYKKMWNSSPVEEWSKLGWRTNDFTHLIQVGVNFEKSAVAREAMQFLNVNQWNFFNPVFWFFFLAALWTPRDILYRIPEIYRATWGKWNTKICARRSA